MPIERLLSNYSTFLSYPAAVRVHTPVPHIAVTVLIPTSMEYPHRFRTERDRACFLVNWDR